MTESENAWLRNRLQGAVTRMEVAADRLDALVARRRPGREVEQELRAVAAWLRGGAAAAVAVGDGR